MTKLIWLYINYEIYLGCTSYFLKTLFPADNIYATRKFARIRFRPGSLSGPQSYLHFPRYEGSKVCRNLQHSPLLCATLNESGRRAGVGALWISNVRSINVRRLKRRVKSTREKNIYHSSTSRVPRTLTSRTLRVYFRIPSLASQVFPCLCSVTSDCSFSDESSGSVKPGDYRAACILLRDNVLEIGQLAPAMPSYSCFLTIYPHCLRQSERILRCAHHARSYFVFFFFNKTSDDVASAKNDRRFSGKETICRVLSPDWRW